MEWISTKDKMPESGDLIVKKWIHNDSIWAGRYYPPPGRASQGDSGFDLWIKLPC